MRYNTFRQICELNKRRPYLKPAIHLRTANGDNLPVKGKANIKFDNCVALDVLIVNDLLHEVILGTDFLNLAKAKMDCTKHYIELFHKKYPFNCPNSSDNCVQHLEILSPQQTAFLDKWKHVFATTDKPLGNCNLEPCTINTGDALPIKQRPRRLPLTRRITVEEQIDDMLKAGVIQPSSSPWASPILLVPKPDGTWRFCIDYRRVNEVTVPDSYALPSVQEIFDSMAGATIFSTLDLKSGYWQIPMHPRDIQKTAFTTHAGNYEFCRMPFGLRNAPSQFQRIMNRILAPYVGKFCMVYLDDIVIYSKSLQQHYSHLNTIFTAIQNANLTLSDKKCHFFKTSLKLLGYTLSASGIAPQE